MKAEDIFEDLEILILQNEDDFDRGSGKFILRKFIKEKQAEQLNLTDVVKTLKKEHQATLTEYATELINMQENPKDSNKEWKIVLIQNTISKLYETLQTL